MSERKLLNPEETKIIRKLLEVEQFKNDTYIKAERLPHNRERLIEYQDRLVTIDKKLKG